MFLELAEAFKLVDLEGLSQEAEKKFQEKTSGTLSKEKTTKL
jgi:hypothetical protein